MNINVNEREALLIVSALGTYQNRVGQHASWEQRKRTARLRARLADCITIGDEEEAKILQRALTNAKKRIEKRIAMGEEINTLKERVKAETGLTDERITLRDDEEE